MPCINPNAVRERRPEPMLDSQPCETSAHRRGKWLISIVRRTWRVLSFCIELIGVDRPHCAGCLTGWRLKPHGGLMPPAAVGSANWRP